MSSEQRKLITKRHIAKKVSENPNYWKEIWQKRKNSEARIKYRPIYNQKARDIHRRERIDALGKYGNKCACCGETTYEFLSIDHINNDGGNHRKNMRTSTIYRWLKQNNYPPGFQVLCHNCNCAKGFYGECPHNKL